MNLHVVLPSITSLTLCIHIVEPPLLNPGYTLLYRDMVEFKKGLVTAIMRNCLDDSR